MPLIDAIPREHADIRVRRLAHRDAEAFARGTEDDAVRAHGHLPLSHYTPQVVRDQIDNEIADGLHDGNLAVLAIADRDSDQLLGSIVLFDIRADRAEVGFWLTPEGRGRGAVAAAVRAVEEVAVAMGLVLLEARTSVDNQASRAALERAGFRQAGEPEAQQTPSGDEIVGVLYELPLDSTRLTRQ